MLRRRARRAVRPVAVRTTRLPGLSPAASSVAAVTARSILRTVRGKLGFYSTPLTVLVMGVAQSAGLDLAAMAPKVEPVGADVILEADVHWTR